jgi:hypothetical protein
MTFIEKGTILYHGTFSDKIDITDGKDTLFFGLERLPATAILTEHQNKRNDVGKVFVYRALTDIEVQSTRSVDAYYMQWMTDAEDKQMMLQGKINRDNMTT